MACAGIMRRAPPCGSPSSAKACLHWRCPRSAAIGSRGLRWSGSTGRGTQAHAARTIPLGRLTTADGMAKAIVWLASSETDHIHAGTHTGWLALLQRWRRAAGHMQVRHCPSGAA